MLLTLCVVYPENVSTGFSLHTTFRLGGTFSDVIFVASVVLSAHVTISARFICYGVTYIALSPNTANKQP